MRQRTRKLATLSVLGLVAVGGVLLYALDAFPGLSSRSPPQPDVLKVIDQLRSKGLDLEQHATVYHCRNGYGTEVTLRGDARPIFVDNCGEGGPSVPGVSTSQDGNTLVISRGALRLSLEGRKPQDSDALVVSQAIESLPTWQPQ